MGSIVTHEEPEEEGMCLAIKIGMHTAVYDMPYDLTFNSNGTWDESKGHPLPAGFRDALLALGQAMRSPGGTCRKGRGGPLVIRFSRSGILPIRDPDKFPRMVARVLGETYHEAYVIVGREHIRDLDMGVAAYNLLYQGQTADKPNRDGLTPLLTRHRDLYRMYPSEIRAACQRALAERQPDLIAIARSHGIELDPESITPDTFCHLMGAIEAALPRH